MNVFDPTIYPFHTLETVSVSGNLTLPLVHRTPSELTRHLLAGQNETQGSSQPNAQNFPMLPKAKGPRCIPQLWHSYSPPGCRSMSLWQYLAARTYDHSFGCNQRPHRWEVTCEHLPRYLSVDNFWNVIPRERTNLQGISIDLCARLIEFSVRFVEKVATHTATRVQGKSTAAAILADVVALAEDQSRLPGHEVWMYAKSVEHPVVAAAVHNALWNKWDRARSKRGISPPPRGGDPYAEPPHVRVPFPRPEDAVHHQHFKFPPGPRWPPPAIESPFLLTAVTQAASTSRRSTQAPRRVPSASFPTLALEEAPPVVAPSTKAARKSSNLVPILPNPDRFAAAVYAAFDTAKSYDREEASMLATLRAAFHEPTTLRPQGPSDIHANDSPDASSSGYSSLALGMEVLVEDLFGPSDSVWVVAQAGFDCQYYKNVDDIIGSKPAFQAEIKDAEMRFWGLVYLAECQAGVNVEQWLQSCPPRVDRACGVQALVTAATQAPLRWFGSDDRSECEHFEFDLDALLQLATRLVASDPQDLAVKTSHALKAAHSEKIETLAHRLVAAQGALSLPAQNFLLYTVKLLNVEADGTRLTHVVWDDEFAEWAGLNLPYVRQHFAAAVHGRSLAHELWGRFLELPDCLVPEDRGRYRRVHTQWFQHPPRHGRDGERHSLEVTFCPCLVPYLRRLWECYIQVWERGDLQTS